MQQIRDLIIKDLDWAKVMQLTERHRIWGLVRAALLDQAAVPLDVREKLSQQADRILRGNMVSLAYLKKLTEALSDRRIAFLVLKGLPLGQQAYGNLYLRHSKDLDLLCRPYDLSSVGETLEAMGFIGRVSERL